MEQELFKIRNDATSLILNASDEEELNSIKLEFLGKSGILTEFLKNLKKVPADQRPEIGKLANETKNTLVKLIEEKTKEYKGKEQEKFTSQKLDITLPSKKPQLGNLHLVTHAIDEITATFEKIGFNRVRHPEVEYDYFAFAALNFPDNHPARDEWETFFIKDQYSKKYGPLILTPHTSSGQVREMLKYSKDAKENDIPPIKMLNIAKCYRRQSDVSHSQMFHQFEGLVVGKNIAITHLKGVLDYFVKSYFGEDRVSRIRPYQFQFTEPSFEVDVSCGVCKGSGKVQNNKICRLCKEGWLEMGGSGMVHPNVLKNAKLDPKKYTGFAFGWGVERVLMMKEGLKLDDLRTLYANDLDFLEQF